jgi:hypothetical protein
MTCPYCPAVVGPRDGVYVTWRHGQRIVAHSECHAKHGGDPGAFVVPPVSELGETLVALISRMLEVEPMGQTPEQWRESLARNVVQRLLNDYEIHERE